MRLTSPPVRLNRPAAGTIKQHVKTCRNFAEECPLGSDGRTPEVLNPAFIPQFNPFLIWNFQVFSRDQDRLMLVYLKMIIQNLIGKNILDLFKMPVISPSHGTPESAMSATAINISCHVVAKGCSRIIDHGSRSFFWNMIFVVVHHFPKFGMQRRFSTHDSDDTLVPFQGIHRFFECLHVHEERFGMKTAETCAVGTVMHTGIGDVYLNDFHVCR